MKHPHADIIKQWIEDTTQEIEKKCELAHEKYIESSILSCINDKNGLCEYRIKPKPDEYEFLRHAIRDGKKIEYFFDDDWCGKDCDQENWAFKYPVEYYRIHDPYREFKEALKNGKRVVLWSNTKNLFVDVVQINELHPLCNYKIANHDMICVIKGYDIEFGHVHIKLTKSGIDGTIKSEVINE